ncbi:MAG: Major facilitator transporter [Verrucomicrobiales bacterium]|nr:Major facilitator transporter [Verrucomicrobiales bacterium]
MNTENPTLMSSLRTLPRPVWILFVGSFLNKFGAFVIPFLAIYLTRQGYTLADAGLAISAYGVGNLVASLLGGYLADTIGRRKTIVLSMVSGAVSMLLLSQAHGLPAIMLLAALTGLTNELYRPAASALLADLVPTGQRVTAFSAYRMAFNAGWAFGPAVAGFLANYGYFWLFIGDAATSILFGLVAWFALPRGVRGQQKSIPWSEALKTLRHDRRLHQAMLAAMTISLVLFQMSSTFGLYVTHLGFSPATYGALISLNGALVVFCELPLTTITRRFPVRRMIALGYLLQGFGFALTGCAHTVPMLVVCVIVFTFGEMIGMPLAGAYVADLSPPHMRGRYSGAYGLTWACGLIIGPAMGMRLFAIGPAVLWFTCGALGVLAALIILANSKT